MLVVPLAGVGVAALAIITRRQPAGDIDVLFSEHDALDPLVERRQLLRAAYGVSLSSVRGGPIFPAMFIGTAGGIALSHLPGLPLIAGVAMGIGALCVVMLTLPLTSVLLALLLLAFDGRPGRHAAGDRRSRWPLPGSRPARPRSRRDANMRAAALPRTVPRRREQCWRHPGSTSRSISSRPRSATPQQRWPQAAPDADMRDCGHRAAAKARGVPVSVASIFRFRSGDADLRTPGGRWRSQVAGQPRRTRPLTVR